MNSDYELPLNLGTEEMVSMNEFAAIAMSYESKTLPIKHIPGPQGVRGRNSDNTLIREKLGWAPSISIRGGLEKAYFWSTCSPRPPSPPMRVPTRSLLHALVES